MEAEVATLRDALPEGICEIVLELLFSKTRDPGHLHEKFDISQDPIGNGSFGNVLLAKCVSSGNRYAIKKVEIKVESSRDVHNFFLQTLQEFGLSLVIGKHANIVQADPELSWMVLPDDLDAAEVTEVLEHGLDTPLSHLSRFVGTIVYMVFDLFTEDLKTAMGRHTCTTVAVLTRSDCRTILLRLLLALHCLHENGVIHNDLKPDNVLLDHCQSEDGRYIAALADLGLTRMTKPSLATSMRRIRRHCYDAPDGSFTVEIDLWSFAMMAFHLTAVANTGRSMPSDLFKWIHYQAMQPAAKSALRKFFINDLQEEDPFFIEALVQCLDRIPDRRPTAMVMFQVLSTSDLFREACRIARGLHGLIDSAILCLEEMIFKQWYKHELMVAVVDSNKFSEPFIECLDRYHENDHFPLIAAVKNCSSEEMQLLSEVLKIRFH